MPRPTRETCGNFEKLRLTLSQPITSLRVPGYIETGRECQRICGEIRKECVAICDPKLQKADESGER